VLTDRGYLRFRVGRTADAAADLLRAAELARAQGSEMYRIDANLRLVTLYSRYGFFDEARALADEALAFYQKLGDRVGIMDAEYGLGDVLRDQGKLEESRAVFARGVRDGARDDRGHGRRLGCADAAGAPVPRGHDDEPRRGGPPRLCRGVCGGPGKP
jgi:tetratricopeptide (TPR) repeat protein